MTGDSPAYAVTGIPVTVYSALAFLRQYIQATWALFPCECFHHDSITGILLYQVTSRVLLLNDWDYTRAKDESQAALSDESTRAWL